ncbi:MAG: hypothetical protein AAFU79_01560, partial [Myxococcota bacterium]
RYMAPEQLWGGQGSQPQGDVFSFGVVLYEMLSGAYGRSGLHTLPLQLPDGLPQRTAWQKVLDRATADTPEERPPHAQALLELILGTVTASSGSGELVHGEDDGRASRLSMVVSPRLGVNSGLLTVPGRRRAWLWSFALGVYMVVLTVGVFSRNAAGDPVLLVSSRAGIAGVLEAWVVLLVLVAPIVGMFWLIFRRPRAGDLESQGELEPWKDQNDEGRVA